MNEAISGRCAAAPNSPPRLTPHRALAGVGLALAVAWTPAVIAGQASAPGYRWEALPEQPPTPAENPQTPEKVLLGQQLFFDPRFSSTGTVSCNSCHNLMLGGDDGRSLSMGVHGLTGPRNAPTVWNAAFHSVQFWDGRAASLEDQARGPVVADVEMGMSSLEAAIARVREIPGYVELFERVFGGDAPVTVDNAASAVAAYERTLITPNSLYDRYVKGDTSALTEQQRRGMQTFAEWGCIACHRGPAFNGPKMPDGKGFFISFPFHDSPWVKKYDLRDDPGRYAVTKNEADRHKYRVPTLRNIALTAPYFHNGKVRTLADAIRVMSPSQLNKELTENQIEDIVAFLGALSGEFPEQPLPRLPPTPGRTLLD